MPNKAQKKVKKPVKAKPAKLARPSKIAKSPIAKGKAAKASKAESALPQRSGRVALTPVPSAPPHKDGFMGPVPDKAFPRATKLPPVVKPYTKREMEQLLTVGPFAGISGEGSLKGKLVVHDGFPYLEVIGRDQRELYFLMQGPDQEVLPAYVDHKVSVSGLLRRTSKYGGVVEVRKYAAKKPEEPVVAEPAEQDRLRFLSPGEIEQVSNAGMGVGVRGYVTIRGLLQATGEDFYIVVSNLGTRYQVQFQLTGKNAKGLKKHIGHTLQVIGVLEKNSSWSGTIEVETCEPRLSETKPVVRSGLEIVQVNGSGSTTEATVKLNNGLSVKFHDKVGHLWAVDAMVAKRVSLREVVSHNDNNTREFFFTPRHPGVHEVEFYQSKAFNPLQVTKSVKLTITVAP